MAITNKQFDEYNRHLMQRLKRVAKLIEGTGNEEAKTNLQEIIDDLQKSIEA